MGTWSGSCICSYRLNWWGGKSEHVTQGFSASKVEIDYFENKREGLKISVANGIDGGIDSVSGESLSVDVEHTQTVESQSSLSGGLGLAPDTISVGFGTSWGDRKSSSGTNFTTPDSSLVQRTDHRQQDSDTRAGFNANVSVSLSDPSRCDVGVGVQVGDHQYGFDTGTVRALGAPLSAPEGGHIGSLSDFTQTVGSMLGKVRAFTTTATLANELADTAGLRIPGIREGLGTLQFGLDRAAYLNANLAGLNEIGMAGDEQCDIQEDSEIKPASEKKSPHQRKPSKQRAETTQNVLQENYQNEDVGHSTIPDTSDYMTYTEDDERNPWLEHAARHYPNANDQSLEFHAILHELEDNQAHKEWVDHVDNYDNPVQPTLSPLDFIGPGVVTKGATAGVRGIKALVNGANSSAGKVGSSMSIKTIAREFEDLTETEIETAFLRARSGQHFSLPASKNPGISEGLSKIETSSVTDTISFQEIMTFNGIKGSKGVPVEVRYHSANTAAKSGSYSSGNPTTQVNTIETTPTGQPKFGNEGRTYSDRYMDPSGNFIKPRTDDQWASVHFK